MSYPQLTSFTPFLHPWREQLFRWRDMHTAARMEVMKALYRAPQ